MQNDRLMLLVLLFLCEFLIIHVVISCRKVGRGPVQRWFSKIRYGRREDAIECAWCHRLYIPKKYKGKIRRKRIMSDIHFKGYCGLKCISERDGQIRQKFQWNNCCDRHPFERKTFNKKCWKCYLSEWTANHPKGRFRHTFILLLHGFRYCQTMRTSEDSWSGDKVAFEQLLTDKRKRWIVYVKFYRKKSNKKFYSYPLVVGKSGTGLVQTGTDLSFSMNPEDGPARRFLLENNLSWNHDWIMVKSFRSEKSAYAFESKIQKIFGLYGS